MFGHRSRRLFLRVVVSLVIVAPALAGSVGPAAAGGPRLFDAAPVQADRAVGPDPVVGLRCPINDPDCGIPDPPDPLNRPPIASAGGPYTVVEGELVSLSGVGKDPDGDAISFAWDLNGDGQFEAAGQRVTFSAAGRDGPSSQEVTLQVCDARGACVRSSTGVAIGNSDPIIVAVNNSGPIDEGSAVTVSVKAGDPAGGLDPLSYAFDCNGDGVFEVGPQPASATACAFSDNGQFPVNVRVADGDGGTAAAATTVVVNNLPPSIGKVSTTVAPGGKVDLVVEAKDPAGKADLLAYAFDCNNDGAFEIGPQPSNAASCAFGSNGVFIIGARVTDGDGGAATAKATVSIGGNGPTITSVSNNGPIVEGGSTTITVAASPPTGGGTLSYEFDCNGDGAFEVGPQPASAAACAFGDNGQFPVNVRVGAHGQTTPGGTTVAVTNAAPTATFKHPDRIPDLVPFSLALEASADAPADAASLVFDFDCGDGQWRGFSPAGALQCPAVDGVERTARARVKDKDGGLTTYDARVPGSGRLVEIRQDFNGLFPADPWRLDSTIEGVIWGKSACAPGNASPAAWALGGAACTTKYPKDLSTFLILDLPPGDLKLASRGELSFRLWRDIAPGDALFVSAVRDGAFGSERFDGRKLAWEPLRIDFAQGIAGLGRLLGGSDVTLSFQFKSNGDLNDGVGPFIDDVVVRYFVPDGGTAPAPSPSPSPSSLPTAWYFAEGYTGGDFHEFLTIQNPNDADAAVRITYFLGGGQAPVVKQLTAPARSRTTVAVHEPALGVGRGQEVSAKVEATNGVGVVAERPMYFTYAGATIANVTGGHNAMGATAPRQSWLFAEGYTGPGFDEYLTIMNPNPQPAPVAITYFLGGGQAPIVKHITVPANARYTVVVHDAREGVGRNQEVSARVETSLAAGIVVERPVYFRYGGSLDGVTGGHDVMGAAGPQPAWLFPDGNTAGGFDEYLTLMNVNPAAAQVRLTYYVVGEATPRTKEIVVPANSRSTVTVHDPREGVGRDRRHGTKVETTNGVDLVVERPLYFRYSNAVNGGHNVMGASAPATAWHFAEGYTGPGFDEELVILNPNATPAEVTITYFLGGAKPPVERRLTVGPLSRAGVPVHDAALGVGRGEEVSARVGTSNPGGVAVERPMYFVFDNRLDGGHTVLGFPAS